MEIGQRIKKIRELFGLTQSELAASIGVTQAHVSRIELGKEQPSAQFITALCAKYDIREEWVKSGKGEMRVELCERLVGLAKSFGWNEFWNAVEQLRSTNGIANLQDERRVNPELSSMLDYLKKLWESGDRDIQGWLKIQFKRAFPEFEEEQKKQRGIAAEGTANGA